MARICFIRHGETDWNVELRMQGHIDRPLNANGFAQAEALGRCFRPEEAVAIYSSDLLRARQTAAPVARVLGLDVRHEAALRERNFGRCEGMTLGEIAQAFAAEAEALRAGDPEHVPLGGESRRQHQERVLVCVDVLAQRHAGQSIVVVTHGGVLDVVCRRARGLPLTAPRDYPIPNTGINRISIENGVWKIESWADTTHLDCQSPN